MRHRIVAVIVAVAVVIAAAGLIPSSKAGAQGDDIRKPLAAPVKALLARSRRLEPGEAPDAETGLHRDHGTELRKVEVVDIHKDTKAPRRMYDPSHPDADEQGFVELPNIEVMTEMVNMIAATRALISAGPVWRTSSGIRPSRVAKAKSSCR